MVINGNNPWFWSVYHIEAFGEREYWQDTLAFEDPKGALIGLFHTDFLQPRDVNFENHARF